MKTFPYETRHRSHQLETFDDMDLVTRKFLATQIPKFLDWRQVYPFVSNDLTSVEFRAPGKLAQYANFKEIDPQELQALLSNAQKPKDVAVFEDYCQKVQPPLGKEVLAFFLHGQSAKNLAHHVETLLAPNDKDEQRRLIKAIKEYVPAEALRADMTEQVGLYVADMRLQAPVIVAQEDEEQEGEQSSVEDVDGEDSLVLLATPKKKAWQEEEHWENPVLKAFKAEAGLSTKFSSAKAAKQIVLKNCSNGMPVGRHLMGKFQTKVPCADYVEAHYPPFSLVDSLEDEAVEAIVKHPTAQHVYHALMHKPSDNREWIKSMIKAASNVPLETHKRYCIQGLPLADEIVTHLCKS
jgi:hypothetical protein